MSFGSGDSDVRDSRSMLVIRCLQIITLDGITQTDVAAALAQKIDTSIAHKSLEESSGFNTQKPPESDY
jgi:hypothetical protein